MDYHPDITKGIVQCISLNWSVYLELKIHPKKSPIEIPMFFGGGLVPNMIFKAVFFPGKFTK